MSLGVTATYFVAQRNVFGWYIAIVLQLIYGVYAVTTAQWGFLISATLYLGMNSWIIIKWRREGHLLKSERRDDTVLSCHCEPGHSGGRRRLVDDANGRPRSTAGRRVGRGRSRMATLHRRAG
jgi:hypothetical protein